MEVAKLSDVLNVLIHGHMREACEGVTTWEHVTEATFLRFGQFVITGDYDPASPRPAPITHLGDPEIGEGVSIDALPWTHEARGWNDFEKRFLEPTPSSHYLPWTHESRGWNDFEKRFLKPAPRSDAPQKKTKKQKKRKKVRQDYTDIFISHVDLFILADYYGICSLEACVVRKLGALLGSFKLCPSKIKDFIRLVEYTYGNVPKTKRHYSLHELLADYAVRQSENRPVHRYIRMLVAKCTEYGRDIVYS